MLKINLQMKSQNRQISKETQSKSCKMRHYFRLSQNINQSLKEFLDIQRSQAHTNGWIQRMSNVKSVISYATASSFGIMKFKMMMPKDTNSISNLQVSQQFFKSNMKTLTFRCCRSIRSCTRWFNWVNIWKDWIIASIQAR